MAGKKMERRPALPPSSRWATHLSARPTPHATDGEKAAIKKYESKFVTLDPAPEYTIDRINNGLYR